MAFGDPIQWIIIGVVVIVIFLWGPSKIPEFARSIGRARKELEVAKKEIENPTETPLYATAQGYAPTSSYKSGDDLLSEAARKIGISTEGKTREQISREILEKT